MNIPIQVTVDLIQEYQLFTFTAKQKDIGRSAVITVTANGQVIPVTEADGANIYIAKPDGTKVYNACRFDNGRVVAELTNQMLASAGTAKVELELGAASGSRITTPIFNLKVLPTQIDGTAIESSNEFTALQQALLQVGEIATMRADIGDLTKLKTTAKSSLVDAVNEQNSKFAPAGFGLGESGGRYCDNPDLVITPGFYSMGGENVVNSAFVDTTFSIFKYGTLLVENRYGFIWQTFKYNGYVACRFSTNEGTSWSELEWVNPPMELGIEYRTTERWNGKPIYVTLVNFGALPNASIKTIISQIAFSEIVGVEGMVSSGGGANPISNMNGLDDIWIHGGTQMNINVMTSTDLSEKTMTLIVKYTKD